VQIALILSVDELMVLFRSFYTEHSGYLPGEESFGIVNDVNGDN
jgi:hypothetical protein